MANDDLGASRPPSFLGSGLAFPLRADGRGGLALVSEEQAIERSIRLILRTAKGERRMRPEFGSGIREAVFAPMNTSTMGLVRHHVTEALGWWEPRIDVQDVIVQPSPDQDGLLVVSISYVIKSTNDQRNLVFPFYVIPGEEEG